MQGAVNDFIADTVRPILYPDGPPYPDFALKSVDKIVEDQSGPCCLYPFSIMDVTIAFDD